MATAVQRPRVDYFAVLQVIRLGFHDDFVADDRGMVVLFTMRTTRALPLILLRFPDELAIVSVEGSDFIPDVIAGGVFAVESADCY